MRPLRIHSHLPRRSLIWFAAGLFALSFVTAFYFKVQPSVEYHQKLLQEYVQEQQADAAQILSDSVLMRKLVLQSETLEEFKEVEEKEYGIFLFAETLSDNQDLLFWNNQKILPPSADFNLKDGDYFQSLANGYYVITKKTLKLSGMTNNLIIYIMIPVQQKDILTTGDVKRKFPHDNDADKKIEISSTQTDYPVRNVNGQELFFIKRIAHSTVAVTDILTVIIRLLGLLFLLIYIHIMAERIVRKTGIWNGVAFLFGGLLLSRLVMYFIPQFFSFNQFELFKPWIYASNMVNKSLGDLLINAIMLCWIILFTWYNVGPIRKIPSFLKGQKIFIAGVLAVFVLIFSTFQLANVVRSLVADSKISFNVIEFFSLDIYTVVGFIVLALLSLAYYYFTRLLLNFIFTVFKGRLIYVYFLIGLIGLVFLTFRMGEEIVLFHIPVLIWLVIYTLLISQEKFIINRFRATVAGMLFWIFIFSISLAAIIMKANREHEIESRKLIAEKYDELHDPSAEKTLNISLKYLDNRFLSRNFERFSDPEQNSFLRDSIIIDRTNFSGRYRRYETKIYVYDSLNKPVNNDDPTSFAELNSIYTLQSKSTEYPDLNYYETSFERFSYITKKTIRDSAGLRGTLFIISTPRHYGNTEALSGKLYRQPNPNDPENSPNYSYAIYKDNRLLSSSTKYPFQIYLTPEQVPEVEYTRRQNDDYDELWYKASTTKVVVVAKKRDSLLESITLFSYLFCAFLFMVGILQLISFLFRIINEPDSINPFAQFNIRTQIHGTVIFVSVLSFLVIGAATISFFISRYNRNNVDRLSRTAGVMEKEIRKSLKEVDAGSDSAQVSPQSAITNLRQLVNEVADIHNTDVNIYDLDGNLKVSSETEVYKQGVLSVKMHPRAFFHLNNLREVQRVQKENISSLDYLSIYTVIRDNSGVPRMYLNIPYFASQQDLNQEISNFLVTIINLNAFIFLIAGIIALFITNKITQSFSVIGEKMREITLGKTNEEIVWNKNDEIGELVKQYNKMVHQLEKSAEALAKSEREGAWREMARQVAHEIKNPLTPMKLSIQYLQKAINTNKENVKELTENVANTLIEQIDHLSKIAADFSQFANISIRKTEVVDLHQVIGSLVELYGTNPRVDIQWEKKPGVIMLKADKTHMNRLFTNLLANAVDACASKPKCSINIGEQKADGSVIIRISDNGEGIPEEMRTRIFTPNFTTKTSGTGLGLAMCKSIVEQSRGEIWFETETGKGTSFFVELPLIK